MAARITLIGWMPRSCCWSELPPSSSWSWVVQ